MVSTTNTNDLGAVKIIAWNFNTLLYKLGIESADEADTHKFSLRMLASPCYVFKFSKNKKRKI